MRFATCRLGCGAVAGVLASRSQACTAVHTTRAGPSVTNQLSTTTTSSSPLHPASQLVFTARRCYTARTCLLQQSWSRERVRPWMCIAKECRHVNRAVANECESCQAKKPVLQRWKCVECGSVNFAGVKQCKSCKALAERSKGYWMCAACCENNRVDELEDNSVCGFCSYDMAPRTAGQEEAARREQEKAAANQQQQENYDSIPFKDADEQFSDPLDGAENLDPSLRQPLQTATTHTSVRVPKINRVTPIALSDQPPVQTRHSQLRRKSRTQQKLQTIINAQEAPQGPPGFDWMCRVSSCGHINPGDEENCLQCGTHVKPEEWECLMCAALNHPSRARCFNCRTSIPVCWTCAGCNTATSIYDKLCRSCGTPRPETEPKRLREVEAGGATRRFDVTMQKNERRGEWYCPSCQKLNFSRRSECFECGAARPETQGNHGRAGAEAEVDALAMAGWGAGSATSSSSGSTSSAAAPRLQNNWICTHCQASNFRTRHDCWKCGRASEHQGEWSKDTTAPQFEHEGFQTGADDKPAEGQMNMNRKGEQDRWTCAKCYALNYRSRTDCFRCGASKMAVTTPRRTRARKPVKL